MSRQEAIKFVLVRSIGNFLLLMSLYGVGMTFGPSVYYEAQYRVAELRGVSFRVAQAEETKETEETSDALSGTAETNGTSESSSVSSGPSFADVLAGSKEQVIVPKDTNFSIVIPKLGASAEVFPNVSPSDPDEFLPVLKKGVAHAKGTVFPGMQGNTYLFAHSADNWWDVGRYNAIFYLLKNLEYDDEIIVFFEDVRYDYVVRQSFIAEPDNVSLLIEKNGPEQLVLQTCWPPGTTLKRQFIVAVPKASVR